jgi:hypothetical protein
MRCASCLLMPLLACGLQAGTIIIYQGDTPGGFSQSMSGPGGTNGSEYVYAGWQMGSTSYSNVTITAELSGADTSVTAYLSNSIGFGAFDVNPIDTSGVISVQGGLDDGSFDGGLEFYTVTLFTGLTLDAGQSYFLTLAPGGTDQVYWGIDDSQPGPTGDPTVTEYPAGFCNSDDEGCDDSNPPNSPFFPIGANPIFEVTGDPITPAPEPSSFAFAAGGLALVAFLRHRRH